MGNNSQTRQNIIDAFWALYAQKDISKISIKELAAKAGYNRGTFYEYFSSTYEILAVIEDSLIASIDDLPSFSFDGRSFGSATEQLFAQLSQKLAYYSLLLGERGDLQFQSRLKRRIKGILKRELFPTVGETSWKLEYALEYMISGLLGVMALYLAEPDALSPVELQLFLKELLDNELRLF